jgi:putative flippase GtrA
MFRVLKYLASGGMGIVVNLGTLHLLADVVGLYYLLSSFLAVSFSTVVGFLLQKFWTFEARGSGGTAGQFGLYVAVAVMNIALNTLIVYVLVDHLGFHHLLAQFIGAGLVAVSSFIIYKKVIFSDNRRRVATGS